jgi:hypothetical protein
MDIDPVLVGVNQTNLQNFSSTPFFAVEQSVEFLKATQDLIHPELEIRRSGFDMLTASGAATNSPLLAYLLVSRLAEPDGSLRARIVRELSSLLDLPFNGNRAVNEVIYFLKSNLAQLRHNQIIALLDLVKFDEENYPYVSKVISQCSHAGDHLSEILADRQAELSTRQVATRLIGDIGYLSALSTLERLETRIESRLNATSAVADRPSADTALLPSIRDALFKLKN